MTWPRALLVGAAAAASMASYWFMICAVLPAIRLRQAAAVNLASNAVANALPAGGALGIGAGIGSDDPVEAEDRLDRIALEPLVEDIAGRTGEELDEIALPFEPERTQAVCDFGCVQETREAGGEALSGR